MANKRPFDSAFLLTHTMPQIDEAIKRRKKDIETSLEFVGDSTKLPKIHDYIKTAIRLCEAIANFHTITRYVPKIPGDYSALVPSIQTLPRHRINPFAFNPKDFIGFELNIDRVFDDVYEKQLQSDSDLNVAKILGSVQRVMFLNSVIESATIAPVYDRGTKPLRCSLCNSTSRLVTMADEQGRACCHPKRDQSVAWPVDEKTGRHPFSSRPTTVDGEREGDAICIKCLYERIIMKDGILKACLVQWDAFELLMMDNAGDLMEVDGLDESEKVGIFCSCQYQNRGAICLFRFSYVTNQNSFLDSEGNNFRPTDDDYTMQERAEVMGFATYDTADYERLNAIYRGICHDPVPFAPKSEEARHQDIITRLTQSNANLQQSVNGLSSTLMNGPATDMMDLDDPTKALEFILSAKHVMDKYYKSMDTLVKHHGNQVLILRDSPDQTVDTCDCCGGYGHESSKMCNLRTDPAITPRAGKKLGEHFAENITLDMASQVVALHKTIELHRWEDEKLTCLFQDFAVRKAKGLAARRNAPSKTFLTRCEAGKGKTRKHLKATPSIPMQTLASLTKEEVANSIHIEMFNSRSDTAAIRNAWDKAGFDTSDFKMNDAWQSFASSHGLDNTNIDDNIKLEALYAFIRSDGNVEAISTEGSETPSTSPKSNGSDNAATAEVMDQ